MSLTKNVRGLFCMWTNKSRNCHSNLLATFLCKPKFDESHAVHFFYHFDGNFVLSYFYCIMTGHFSTLYSLTFCAKFLHSSNQHCLVIAFFPSIFFCIISNLFAFQKTTRLFYLFLLRVVNSCAAVIAIIQTQSEH